MMETMCDIRALIRNLTKSLVLFHFIMISNQSELLNQRNNLDRHRIDKNRLLFASILNLITFLCAVFSMAYPEWIEITFAVNIRQPHQEVAEVTIWSSLLYGMYRGQRLMYPQMQEKICMRDDTFCLAILYELDFTGKLCFSIFLLALLISSYDCFRIIKFTFSQLTTKSKFFVDQSSAKHFKNNFRNIFMIFTYLLGISLDYFAMTFIKLQKFTYGLSFWVFVSSLILFVCVSLWQNRKMSKISRQELIIKLLQNEKKMLRGSSSHSQGGASNHSSDIFTI